MKNIFSIFMVMAVVVVFASCEKNTLDYGDTQKLTTDEALLKVNYVSQYFGNPKIVIKINDVRVSTPITARTPFPGGGYNTGGGSSSDFMLVKPGAVKLSISIPFKVDDGKDSLQVYSNTIQLAAGKNYVAHITDTASNTKTILTEENFVKMDSSKVGYRFINLMPNVPSIDLYYGTSATNHTADTLLASNVTYLQMTSQFIVRYGQSKTWKIRKAGALSTTTPITTYTSASTFTNQRVYNVFASGYTGFTDSRKPYLSFFLVR